MKWETYAMKAADYLRKKGDTLSPADQLRFAEAIPKASERRDAALRSLGLDVKPEPIDLKTYLVNGNNGEARTNGQTNGAAKP